MPAGVLVDAPATFQIQFAPASDGGGVPGGPMVEAAASVVLTAAVPTEVIVLVSPPIVSLPPAAMPATLLTLTLVSPAAAGSASGVLVGAVPIDVIVRDSSRSPPSPVSMLIVPPT